ncbi:MAG: hypothetical protein ACE15B_11030 [Bryobacteraceae bacterium]
MPELEESRTTARRVLRRNRTMQLAGLATAVLGLAGWRLLAREEKPVYSYVTVERGDVIKTISATGKALGGGW